MAVLGAWLKDAGHQLGPSPSAARPAAQERCLSTGVCLQAMNGNDEAVTMEGDSPARGSQGGLPRGEGPSQSTPPHLPLSALHVE